ncbi:tripartite tricarboxylate transporter substrate binding protein [Bengtsoniella intestinalis]|uniref:tripartite tricarboxylate transporter substrate binding protein n=1 Tax=Bengtsoniella intestinalis TaxID=3073143 RepID=UPI00391F1283
MKKVLAFLLAASMMVMTGCSSSSETTTTTTETTTTEAATTTEVATEEDPYADYPNAPVQVTVQWAAGGGADVVFRALAEVFPTYANGQPLVINNVEGASGVTGSTEFMEATPDGYELIHINTAHITKIHMTEVAYDSFTFEPVCMVSGSPQYLLVQADAPWETMEDLVADAAANPGMITIGNAGIGGGDHMSAVLFEIEAGVEFAHIPFSGASGALTGLLSSEVDVITSNAPTGLTNVEAGELRILTNFGANELARFPEVGTIVDDGYDFSYDQWRGVAAPEGTPAELVEKISEIFKQCVEDPTFIQMMADMDASAMYMDTDAFVDYLVEEDANFMQVIVDNGFGDRYV